jgi:hypothetical protein
MVAATKLSMADISRQKRYEAELSSNGLTRKNTVGQAVEHYLNRVGIRDNGLRWTAFSREVKLDHKHALDEITDAENEWTVMPEVSAGAR